MAGEEATQDGKGPGKASTPSSLPQDMKSEDDATWTLTPFPLVAKA
jgi:hypothetical protein